MSTKNTTSNYTPQDENRRLLRIILWFIGGALLLAALCCLCTLAVGWYTGDFFVDLLRNMFR